MVSAQVVRDKAEMRVMETMDFILMIGWCDYGWSAKCDVVRD